MQLKRHRNDLARRAQLLARTGQALLVLLAVGYGFVQGVHGERYRDLADGNRLRKVTVPAARGRILDRHDRALVENTPAYSLWIDRSRSEDVAGSVAFAADALGRAPESFADRLEDARRVPAWKPVPLAHGLSLDQVSRIAVHQLEHPELEVRAEPLRLHRFAHQTAHVLGYLGQISDAELVAAAVTAASESGENSYRPGDLVGKKGIEKVYEGMLRGTSGERVMEVDSRGRITGEAELAELATEGELPGEMRVETAHSGKDLRLTLDLRLQQEAARLFEDRVGSLVALDPRNGEILALVSSPAFDPNRFARGLDATTWRNLLEHPDDPLQNRAVQNTYPPGSVFKIVMAVAALEHGHDPRQKFFCRGYSMIYDHRYRCHRRGGHGAVDLHDAIKYSCNVYFHQLGQRLSIDTIAEVARRFGLGQATGIDLEDEKTGLVPGEAWSLRTRGTPWYPGETISVATGQGPILATPLQMAGIMATVANGGLRPRPHLALDAEIRFTDAGIAPRHLAFLHDALGAVVNEEGTGRSAKIAGFPIAGKTGTAQVVRQETWTDNEELAAHHRDHAWFASYGPIDEPRLVVVVFVEHGGGGSTAAAPLAKALYRRFLEIEAAASEAPHDPPSPLADGPRAEPLRTAPAPQAAP